jgi:uncharacterized membrane protein
MKINNQINFLSYTLYIILLCIILYSSFFYWMLPLKCDMYQNLHSRNMEHNSIQYEIKLKNYKNKNKKSTHLEGLQPP